MTRTTIDLDEPTYRKLRERAAHEGRPMKAVVNDLLRVALADRSRKSPPFRWKTVKGTRPPAVDVADREALYDFFDRNP